MVRKSYASQIIPAVQYAHYTQHIHGTYMSMDTLEHMQYFVMLMRVEIYTLIEQSLLILTGSTTLTVFMAICHHSLV